MKWVAKMFILKESVAFPFGIYVSRKKKIGQIELPC